MFSRGTLCLCLLLTLTVPGSSQTPPASASKSDLPKVVLIGDSIRLGYAPLVAKRLAGKAVVVSPAANGGDSANVLKNLDDWILRERPAIVQLNCGLHDLKLSKKSKQHQVELAPDAYGHGNRVGTGPAGAAEILRGEQESLFKWNLWLGRTLWGMFVRDDQIALDYLCSRPEVDPTRIGATGMSMGSTRAWWLAAVDERIAATVGVACLTRYQNLIAHGQLAQHGVYYFVNGLLKHFDTEGVLALLAPRPFLALTGELDTGSPADGIKIVEEQVGRVYAVVGAAERFQSILYPDVGHTYTPQMRQAMLAWFDRWLKPEAAK